MLLTQNTAKKKSAKMQNYFSCLLPSSKFPDKFFFQVPHFDGIFLEE